MRNRSILLFATLACTMLLSCKKTIVYPDGIEDNDINNGTDKEYVDLGLSVKWATKNLGAESPTEIGNFYSWGETEPKSSYKEENYKFYDSETKKYTKYVDHWESLGYNEEGKLDMIKGGDDIDILEAKDDAATAALGANWRMPTTEECEELMTNCKISSELLTENGIAVRVYTLTGPNGNSISFKNNGVQKSTGYSDHLGFVFWTNSRQSDLFGNTIAAYGTSWMKQSEARHHGLPIRPVYIK